MNVQDPVAIADEIEAVTVRLQASAGDAAAAEAQHLVRLVMSFYGAGLSRIVEIVRAEQGRTEGLLPRLTSDPLVASLLALHDLQPRTGDEALIQISRPSALPAPQEQPVPEERCELCAVALPANHAHLVDIETRRLLCACPMCSAVGGRYRLLPSRYLHLPSMIITPAEWEPLGIPVGLVFFIVDSHRGRIVACYPGPAGATESLLPLDSWPALTARHPWLERLAPDVEALLVRRIDDEYRCYIVPVDACYELIGRIRKAWTGFGGGSVVEGEIDRFFAGVLEKVQPDAQVEA